MSKSRFFICLENVANILSKKHREVLAYLVQAVLYMNSLLNLAMDFPFLCVSCVVSLMDSQECHDRGLDLIWSCATGHQVGVQASGGQRHMLSQSHSEDDCRQVKRHRVFFIACKRGRFQKLFQASTRHPAFKRFTLLIVMSEPAGPEPRLDVCR